MAISSGIQAPPQRSSEDEQIHNYLKQAHAVMPPHEFERVKSKIMAEQVQAQERAMRTKMYDHLLDAFRFGAPEWHSPMITSEMRTIGDVIRDKIAHHKNIIASLEWFASHLSLDKPEESLFVNRVIMEGLRALSERHSPDAPR